MARTPESYGRLASAVNLWRDRCLLSDGSVLGNGQVWTLDSVRQLVRYYVENPDLSDRNFLIKLRDQLTPASPEARKLAAEMLWVMYLIVSENSMQAATKRLQVEKVWGWSGETLPDNPQLLDGALAAGVANPGTAFHTLRWRELVFMIRFVERWKQLPEDRQRELLADGWKFAGWVDDQEESKGRQIRHALLFLLFPRQFEPIVSGQHKRAIVERWYAEAGGSPGELDRSNRLAVDRALAQVRAHLETQDAGIDFYHEPWVSEWRGSTQAPSTEREVRTIDKAAADAWAKEEFGGARVWAMAAGEGGRLWPEFQRESLIALGLDELNDLSEYKSKEELSRAISEARGVQNPFNDALAG